MGAAWRVGLLVIVFGAMLVGAYAVLKQSIFGVAKDIYLAEFSDAGGIAEGTRVLMAGVKVGEVQKIDLASPTLARLTLAIDKGVKIPQGSTVSLSSSLIGFGENPLYLIPGSSSASQAPGSTLRGFRTSAVESFFPEAKQTVKELNLTLASVRQLMDDQKLRGGLEKLLVTTEQTVAEFGTLAKQFGGVANKVDSMIGENRALLGQALTNASLAMSDIRKSTKLVSELMADPRWKDQAVALLDSLNKTTAKAENLMVSLDQFVNDPKLREPLAKTMAHTETIAESGTRIAANAEKMTENGIVLSEKAIEIADKASGLADEAKKVLEKFQNLIGKAPNTNVLNQVEASLDLVRESDPAHYRTDLEVSVPFRENRIHVGLFDAFESNKISLQLGKKVDDQLSYRYGIYASKPGIGVDYALAPRLFLRGDLFDINNPRADLRARMDFGNGFYGWLGVNQLFKRNAPMIGFGIRR